MADKVFTVAEPEAPEPIPVGMYEAKFTSWEEKDDGGYGPYVRLEFEITEGVWEGTKRTLIASSKMTKGKNEKTTSKLFRTITGLLGREPAKDESVSLNSLLETGCQILVEDRPGNTEGWQDITKVMPAKK